MAEHTITFIGAGNMATSLIGGLVATGYPAQSIRACDPLPARREEITAQFGVAAAERADDLIEGSDVVVLAVKPQVLRDVVLGISGQTRAANPLVLSIAAGIAEPDIRRWLGYDAAVIRTMPNTPALLGSGITGMVANAHVSAEQREVADAIMRAVGRTEIGRAHV